jgi:hypothetical protein
VGDDDSSSDSDSESDSGGDGGNEHNGEIGDAVFCDLNDNGIQDDAEPGIPNVEIKVRCMGPDGRLHTHDDTFHRQRTDENGNYLFTGLPAGRCVVRVNVHTLPPDKKRGQCPIRIRVNLPEGESILAADFCFRNRPDVLSQGGLFEGYLDDLRIYCRALSVAEVDELFARQGAPTQPPPAVPDVDGDGIADYLEDAYTDSTVGMDADGDMDGDTSINLHEVMAGSNPMDFNSVLAIEEITHDGTAYTISWQSESGRVYRCMGATNVLDAFVQIGPDVPATPPINIESIREPNLKLFRIELVQ